MSLILKLEEYVCPVCGLILDSMTMFHKHYAKEHK